MKGIARKKRRKIDGTYESVALSRAFEEDEDTKKVDLSTGVYRTDSGECWTMPCVTKVKQMIANEKLFKYEELDPLGDDEFCKAATSLLFGRDDSFIDKRQIFSMQTISSTGALRIASEFIFKCLNYRTVYTSDPTWENHEALFQAAGFTDFRKYRYWGQDKSIDFQGLITDLSEAPPNSVIVLQPCGHNPTGRDLTPEQWQTVADIIESRKLFPIFDAASIGLATGSTKVDCQPLRLFASRGVEMIVATSFGQNFLIYNERVGCLMVVTSDKKCLPAIRSQMSSIVQGLYGSPANHGMKLVKTILTDDHLYKEWKQHLKAITTRMLEVRLNLEQELLRKRTRGIWDHISQTQGMFCYSGLTPRQVEHLVFYYHIYLMKNGRINVCGLTCENVDYVAQAIRKTVREYGRKK